MKGASGPRVFLRHVLRNASLGILTIIGVQFGAMLGGSVVAEVTFGYPGVGRCSWTRSVQRDYAAAQAPPSRSRPFTSSSTSSRT
jgi:peptide/nickel transport system permease protein